jgi:superfamily II DNA helicase RecQ
MPTSTARVPVAAQKQVKVDIEYEWTKEIRTKLSKVFKLQSFRQNQKEAIDATMAGDDGELGLT